MKLQNVIVVLRHNTQLGGDLLLAQREFDALMGDSGTTITKRSDLKLELGGHSEADRIEIAAEGAMIGRHFVDVPMELASRLLSRSAFAQEVFVIDSRDKVRSSFIQTCPLPCRLVSTLEGPALIVALSQSYIIESEAVLDSTVMEGRIASTVELLFEPYRGQRITPKANRLRRAKKTTLSLSHDLHIYKAKFFPRMVRGLLNIFSKPGATVFDPYCGSGTALLEASLLGLDSFGSDIDPICHLISRTKVAPFIRESALTASLKRFEDRLVRGVSANEKFHFPSELHAKISRRDRIDQTTYLEEIVGETGTLFAALEGMRRDHAEEELFFTLASDAVTKKVRFRFVGVGNGRYTIEILRQPLLLRMREKVSRSQQLAGVFSEITSDLNTKLGTVRVSMADARDHATWPVKTGIDVIVTSPPYLPASSGREHYAASRALAFSVLGFRPGEDGYFDNAMREDGPTLNLNKYPESARLMAYLESDASVDADPQRDAMRFERKAIPTLHYLGDMRRFFESARMSMAADGVLLLVVAHHHIFYSHRRGELEHVVSGRALYEELAADAGFEFIEEIEMELKKASTTRARPMAKEEYYESVLVFKPRAAAQSARRRIKAVTSREHAA